MDILGIFSGFGHGFVGYLVPFLFVLTVVVFFHELGHFLVARWCGVTVKVFSVGFGPELFGFNDRRGTRWKLAAIPLGGYVKFLGDENEASTPDREALARLSVSEREGAFAAKNVGRRAAIVAAGPIANFLLTILIFAVVFTLFGRQVTSPKVDQVVPDSAAAAAGLQPGDVIRSIDGSPIETFSDLQRVVSVSAGVPLRVTFERAGELKTVTVTPENKQITDRFGNAHRAGVLGISRSPTGDDIVLQRFSPPAALWLALKETWFVVDRTLSYLGGVLIGTESTDQLGGPIRVAQMAGDVAAIGFLPLVNLAALLSVSIGLINLFPVPMLDGGHLLFYLFEAVRGRPLSERVQEIGFRIGFVLVILLMVFATWNDIGRPSL